MSVTTSNLIQGPATLYHGAFGTAEPADTDITTAPDVDDWDDVGGTNDGVTMTISRDYAELEVDQLVDTPERRLTKRDMTIETNMAEATLENFARVLNDTAPTTGTGFKKYEPTVGSSATQPTYSALIIDGYAPNTKRRRVMVRKALATDDVEFAYKKEDQTVFSVKWMAHYVSSSIKPYSIVDGT